MLLTFCVESMAEVPDSGEDHGQTKTIGGGNYFVIFYRTARLNNRCCAGGGDCFKSVWKREEGV